MTEKTLSDPLAIIGLLFALLFLIWLSRVSNSGKNTYKLSDLITTKGRMDLSKVGQLICLLTTTWIVIHMELKSVVAEWALGLYMLAWVGAGFGSLYARIRGATSASSETTSSETTTSTHTGTTQTPLVPEKGGVP